MSILNDDGLATSPSEITIYNYDSKSRAYLFSCVEYLAVGVGIPAHSCIDAPPDGKAGYAICRDVDLTAWEYVTDHRGETVYSTETRLPIVVSVLGEYPPSTTKLQPVGPFDRWDGSRWVTDKKAQHADDVATAERKKASLLAEAQAAISIWQTELQLGIISDADKDRLIDWLGYIKAVKAVDTFKPLDITWPQIPT